MKKTDNHQFQAYIAYMGEADIKAEVEKMKRLLSETNRIMRENPELDRDNVRHTLILLSEKPEERLERSLRRGRSIRR